MYINMLYMQLQVDNKYYPVPNIVTASHDRKWDNNEREVARSLQEQQRLANEEKKNNNSHNSSKVKFSRTK